MRIKTAILAGILSLLASVTSAVDLFVSPNGDDANLGSKEAPLATLERARQKIGSRALAGKQPVTVHVADGVYYLPETLVFTSNDSGNAKCPIVYLAENEGGAVLSGGAELKLSWEPHKKGIFKAQTPEGLQIDQLFIDGKNQRMARYPNYDASKKAQPYQGYAADAFSRELAANWANPTGGYIHSMHRAGWGGYHYRITGKGADGDVTYEGGWQNNRRMGMHKDHRMVENIFEELDAPGEWYHNAKSSTLYCKPQSSTDLSNAKIEVVRLRHLVEFRGTEDAPVRFIALKGFKVRHAARTFMDTKEPLLRSDWAIYRGGAFLLTGTEDVGILDCEFDQVGGNAVFVNNYNRRVLVKGCHIHDTGASGVCFVGDPDAVRNPLFEYGQTNDLATIDRTPGPKTNNYPAQSTVEDCLIHGIGRVERQPAGVQIEMAAEITVRDCSVYDTARAGINIGDGAWGGHLIERCDVFDTVLETHDHGSFNSWGRDRYWRHDHLTASQKAVDVEPNLPFLDAMKTTVIRNSRWRCEHGWDIDLDDGSSNYDIFNNLMLCGGLKLREGFRRRAWNNVIINNGLSSHVWFQESNDQVTGNIMARANTPYIKNNVTVDGLVDKNFYYEADESHLRRNVEEFGWDRNSKFGDPLFVDPDKGDFTVEDGSPAFAIGFENFPMDQFGVKKPALKAIAATPSFLSKSRKSASSSPKKPAAEPLAQVWLGAILKDLNAEEFSAFGVSKNEGGVALAKVPKSSVAAQAGLKEGDLIQGVGATPVSNTTQLFKVLLDVKSASLNLKVVRNQQTLELSVKPRSSVVMETASVASGFTKLPLPNASTCKVTANQHTANDPLIILTDGKLGTGFGPVFPNAVYDGTYKMDLGSVKPVRAITSWSFNCGNTRVAQKLTIYGSNSQADPGWNLSKFTPLGTVDSGETKSKFLAASLRATEHSTLGNFRWIVWRVSPVSDLGGGENTAFQELVVEAGEDTRQQTPAPKQPEQISTNPNVILVMTDDQGWGEVGFHGNKVLKTPNLDRFAAEGTELTNFYVSPMCTPTRSSLMTGRYHFRTGAHDTYIGRSNMNPQETTIAEVFAAAGYRTGIFGKWHLGENYPMRAQDQGFQEVVVHGGGGIGQLADYPGNTYWNPTLLYNDAFKKANGYCTDIFIDESIRFISASREKPFFCYIPLNIPHAPFHVDKEFSEPYQTQMVERDRNWTAPIYGMITQFDVAFQRLLDAVDEMGLTEDTIIIFMTDNGPNSVYYTAGLRAKKGSVYENGFRVPFVVRWPGGIEGGRKLDDPTMHIDLLPTLAEACDIELPDGLDLDGQNMLPLLKGEVDKLPERYLFMQHNRANVPPKFSNCMVRKGPWKAVQPKGKPAEFELYNIEHDPGEKKNLAGQHPDMVKAFVREYETWFDDVTADLQRNEGIPHPIELNPIQKQDFRFTWQDWWGEETGWRPTNYGAWRMNNPGLIERFDVTIVPRQHHGMPAIVDFIWQRKTLTKKFDRLPAQVSFEDITLPQGTGFMEAQIHIDGKMWGVQEVQIRPHGAKATTRPPDEQAAKVKEQSKLQLPTRSLKLPEVRGRFVRIELPGENRELSLAEVSVFEKGMNLALKKKATQSSIGFSGVPARAVDGNPDGNYLNGSVTHTKSDGTDPWWEIDLGQLADVEQVLVHNRTDSHGERLNNFTLKILDAEREVVFSHENTPQSAVISFLKAGVKPSQIVTADREGGDAENLFPGVKSDFRGYDRYDRIKTSAGHFSVVCPQNPAPGKPWLWRSLFWEAIKKVSDADLKLVDEGYHVVLAHGDVAGHPSGNANIDAAYDLLTTEYGFSKKCSMASMSRGTLSLFRWASANPEMVDSIYVDNGVCNVLSWPAGKLVEGSGSKASGAPSSWEYFKKKFGYTSDEEALKTKESPIDQLESLAKAGVPILMVCGSKDTAVPYEENDAIMEKRYKALGGSFKVIVEDKGHSHGMKDPTPVLNFIRENTSAAEKRHPSGARQRDENDEMTEPVRPIK